MSKRLISKCLAIGIIATSGLGTNVTYGAVKNKAITQVKEYTGAGQVLDVKYPNLSSSSAVLNNSAQNFKAYKGQGEIYLKLNGVESVKVFVNGKKVDLKEYFGKDTQTLKVDISQYTITGENTLQIFDVQPKGATIEVDIPYPTLRVGKPSDVGMDEEVFNLIDDIIEAEIAMKGVPGGQLVIAKDGVIIKNEVYGTVKAYDHKGEVNNAKAVDKNTLYDLASNTKMYTANYAIQKLVFENKLDIDAKIDEIIPGFSEFDPMKAELTVRHLLTHTGGFIPDPQYHNENYLHPVKQGDQTVHLLDQNNDGINDVFTQDPDKMLEMVKKTPLEYTPGTKNVYSDVDYILLGMIVESISGLDLETYCQKNIFGPLGLKNTMFNPLQKGRDKENIAATELFGNTREGNVTFKNVRTEVVQGEVHDEKAFYSMGGVSGHAGLFGTAEELAVLMQVMINGGGYGNVKLFDQHTIDTFVTPSGTNDTYGLGWRRQGDGGYGWSFGKQASDSTIGHTGWTGTSTNINIDEDLLIVWLTNTKNTPIADPSKNVNSMEGDAFQFDAAGTLSTLVYQSMTETSDALIYEMTHQMMEDRVDFLNNKIESSGSATEADYKATFALANVWKAYAEKTISKEEMQDIIETLPEHSLKQALMNQ